MGRHDALSGYVELFNSITENPDSIPSLDLDLENINYDIRYSSDSRIRRCGVKLLGLIGTKDVERYLLEVKMQECPICKGLGRKTCEDCRIEELEYELVNALVSVSTPSCARRAIEIMESSTFFEHWNHSSQFSRRIIFSAMPKTTEDLYSDFLHKVLDNEIVYNSEVEFNGMGHQFLLEALNRIGSKKSEEVILSIIHKCKNYYVSIKLMHSLGFVGGIESIEFLRKVLTMDKSEINHLYIGTMADGSKVELDDRVFLTYKSPAAVSLARLDDLESGDKMIELWHQSSSDALCREELARAFGLMRYAPSVEILVGGSSSDRSSLRQQSVISLGLIANREAKQGLLSIAQERKTSGFFFEDAALKFALSEIGEHALSAEDMETTRSLSCFDRTFGFYHD
jgi:hypothetical protein